LLAYVGRADDHEHATEDEREQDGAERDGECVVRVKLLLERVPERAVRAVLAPLDVVCGERIAGLGVHRQFVR
jgi:hypothetical protein